MFLVALFIIARKEKQSRCPQIKNGQRKCPIIQWIITQQLKMVSKNFSQINETRKKILSVIKQSKKDKHGIYSLKSAF